MKNIGILFLLVGITAFSCSNPNDFPSPEGPYLGQNPPGKIPELFAPGVITTEYHEHSSPAFSPDGREVFWSVFINFWGPQVILLMRQKDGFWSQPEVAPFSGQYTDGNPFFTKDGQKIYFESSRPVGIESNSVYDLDLWVVCKAESGWGEPQHLGFEINSDKWERGPSLSDNGNLYFSSMRSGGYGQSDIYLSEFVDGSFSEPKNLGPIINTPGHESWPFIAPDESHLMYESSSGDIFINFKHDDGSWSETINMAGPLKSTENQDRFPKLSNDGKYLFFVSNRRIGNRYFDRQLSLEEIKQRAKRIGNGMGDVYWVDAAIIAELKNNRTQSPDLR